MVDPLFAALSLAAALAVFSLAGTPVARPRLQRFAQRHDLTVTLFNSPSLVSYLAVTRRWRAAGATFGGALYALQSLSENRLAIGLSYLVGGWLAGVLAAEVQLARAARPGLPGSAADPARYLAAPVRWALPSAVVACLLLTAPAAAALDGAGASVRPVWWLVTALLAGGLTWTVTRMILRRPRLAAEPDLAGADDATRSRSLHALAAGATVTVLYVVLDQLSVFVGPGDETAAWLLILSGLVALPWLAWRLATSPWRVPPAEGAAA